MNDNVRGDEKLFISDFNSDNEMTLLEKSNNSEDFSDKRCNIDQQLMIQDEFELDYEAEQFDSISEDKEDDDEDNVTITINNDKKDCSTVAYVCNEEDNTYNVTNYEIELKNRIDLKRLHSQSEDLHLFSILKEYRDLKQQYYFLKNIPISERINIPIFYDYQSDKVKRVIVVPHIILKPTIYKVIYNLINTPWLIKPKSKAFRISSDYIQKYIEQINSSKLFRSSSSLQLCRGYIALLSTSYFKIGRAKCLAGLTVAIYCINNTNDVKLIDFITTNHVNIHSFHHNEDQLRDLLEKYNVIKIYCWLPNYGTVHNTLYGNVYWFNEVLINIQHNRRLYNLYDKINMEKNFDTTTLCVNSIKHSERCSYCNMMRLAIKIFNDEEVDSSLSLINRQPNINSKNKVKELVSLNSHKNLRYPLNENSSKYCKSALQLTHLPAATSIGLYPPTCSQITPRWNKKLSSTKWPNFDCRGRNRSKLFDEEMIAVNKNFSRSHLYRPYLFYGNNYQYAHNSYNH